MIALAVLVAAGVAALAGYVVTREDEVGAPAPPAVVVIDKPQPMRTLTRPRPLRIPALAAPPVAAAEAPAGSVLAPPPAAVPSTPSQPQSPSDTYVGPAI